MDFEIIKGTSKTIKYTVYDNDGNVYTLQPDDKLIFGVKKTDKHRVDSNYLIKKIITSNNKYEDGYLITFNPEDTQNADTNFHYDYDIGLQFANGEYYMVTECSMFRIKRAITSKE